MNKKTKVVLLGSRTSSSNSMHSGPSVAITVNDSMYLIDAGSDIINQINEMYSQGFKEFRPNNIRTCFLTHLHSNHTIGLPDLILTPWIQGRNKELNIFGPNGTKDMVDNLYKAYKVDLESRLSGLDPVNESGYKTIVKELDSNYGLIYEDENIKVEPIFADHMPLTSYSYKFITEDKTIIISGDTSPAGGITVNEEECDILVHEVFSSEGLKSRSMEWAIYSGSVHTSSIDLGKVAKKINPKKLVLYNQLFMGEDKNTNAERKRKIIEDIKVNYEGEVIFGENLKVIS